MHIKLVGTLLQMYLYCFPIPITSTVWLIGLGHQNWLMTGQFLVRMHTLKIKFSCSIDYVGQGYHSMSAKNQLSGSLALLH